MKRQRILIAGFGDTGVLTAINLPKKYDITAVGTKPLLLSGQELGMRITDPGRWQEDYKIDFARFKHLEGVNILHGEVSNPIILLLHFLEYRHQRTTISAILLSPGVDVFYHFLTFGN